MCVPQIILKSLFTLSLLSLGTPAESEAASAEINFSRDVRPVLASRCFECHGPDRQESGLRLDRRESAFRETDSGGVAIVAGKPQDSELFRRVVSDNVDERMPPEGQPLSREEIDTLRRWIIDGAEYTRHWAYIRPQESPAPAVRQTSWPQSPIDHFVLSRLEAESLAPSPPADRYTLIRRLYLDIVGLPPPVEEVDAFVCDQSPDAYEDLVDRLLQSPRFGERWARWWLDMARYGDTNGYESDEPRTMWPWRDWVIQAFNRNLSFDQFTIEQLAGDLLSDPTEDQLVATGFHRNTLVNSEAGSKDDEFKDAAIKDRTDTTFAVWLAATFGCAQCHSHKYDDFSQREYYQVYAFFNNTTEKATEGESDTISVFFGDPGERARRRAEVDRLRAVAPLTENPEASLRKWERNIRQKMAVWQTLDAEDLKSSANSTLKKQSDLSVLATGANPDFDNFTFVASPAAERLTAIRLEVLTHKSHTNGSLSRGVNGNTLLTEFKVFVHDADGAPTGIEISSAAAEHFQPGAPIDNVIDGDPKSGWATEGHSRREDCRAVFTFASPVEIESGTRLTVHLKHDSQAPLHVIGRFRLAVTDGSTEELLVLPVDAQAALDLDPEERSPQQRKLLRRHYLEKDTDLSVPLVNYETALKELDEFEQRYSTTTMVMREGRTKPTHFLNRGSFLDPGDEVTAGVPKVYGLPLPADQRDRLALARWIVNPDHPVTSRVTVNRVWEILFGRGFVTTSEDFGVQGEPPTHPELLDWLATHFVQTNWDFKGLVKTIVMSRTYQQSSVATPELLERDRYNELLARGPRFRVEAEMIRDVALEIAGMLSPKIGGPSVFPPQPDSIWESLFVEQGLKAWPTSEGEDRYRRGIYTYYKRTALYPMLRNFDAPNRNVCVVSRKRSNTPLAALNTLNDPAFVEAAGGLAQRMLTFNGRTSQRLVYGFRICVARPPTDQEQDVLQNLLQKAFAGFRAHPEQANQLVKTAFRVPPAEFDPVQLAVWISLANTLLNMDATLSRG